MEAPLKIQISSILMKFIPYVIDSKSGSFPEFQILLIILRGQKGGEVPVENSKSLLIIQVSPILMKFKPYVSDSN